MNSKFVCKFNCNKTYTHSSALYRHHNVCTLSPTMSAATEKKRKLDTILDSAVKGAFVSNKKALDALIESHGLDHSDVISRIKSEKDHITGKSYAKEHALISKTYPTTTSMLGTVEPLEKKITDYVISLKSATDKKLLNNFKDFLTGMVDVVTMYQDLEYTKELNTMLESVSGLREDATLSD